MSVRKTDYSKVSEIYDELRGLDKPDVEWWLDRFAQEGDLKPGKRLLDLGCGTGRWTIPLVQRTGCQAVAVDRSPEMLAKAREKDTGG